ncbi:hypothetical protein [Ensifer sp. ZNC0028]|uniref:hypothetical protein n=1 Tax=Ensifer sp. ZNC0028 TaxID=1339236 RepID=UPI00069226DE|nr:hypothetical protein [Ensifer sp. ZNC0028]
MIDAKAFGLELAGIVKAQLDPVTARLDALERRLDGMPTPRDGKDADIDDVRRLVGEELSSLKAAIEAIPAPPEMPEIQFPELPDLDVLVADAVASAFQAMPIPQDGKSVSIEDVRPLVVSEIERQVSALPVAKDGEPGADGIGVAGAIIDRDGNLIITATNGMPYNLGKVVGKDGDPGHDGFSLTDFDATLMDDGRTVLLSFERGEQSFKVELGIPAMIYRGVYREGTYQKGDTVTWGGSLWHCDADETTEKPDSSAKHWTLAAKKGRDGKDGTVKEMTPATPVRVGLPAEAR